jgi:hypothetical protein
MTITARSKCTDMILSGMMLSVKLVVVRGTFLIKAASVTNEGADSNANFGYHIPQTKFAADAMSY